MPIDGILVPVQPPPPVQPIGDKPPAKPNAEARSNAISTPSFATTLEQILRAANNDLAEANRKEAEERARAERERRAAEITRLNERLGTDPTIAALARVLNEKQNPNNDSDNLATIEISPISSETPSKAFSDAATAYGKNLKNL